MSVLLLVRHGQASWGAADYDVLSDLGHEQSRLLAKVFKEAGEPAVQAWLAINQALGKARQAGGED